jgi:hypothetical protein
MTNNPVTFASFSLRDTIDMIVSCNDRSVKEMAMKLSSVMPVLSIVILAVATKSPAPLNAAPQDQGQSATTPNPSTLRIWKDPDRI